MESEEEIISFFENFFSLANLERWSIILIKMIVVYLIIALLVYFIRRLFNRAISRKDKNMQDKTNLIFLRNIAVYTLYAIGFLSILYQIPGLQRLTNTLLAGAGILAAAVAFGSQQAIANIVSGIFMVLFKPFRVGDHIDMGSDSKGTVVDISLRHTTIRNSENRMIIVPNSVLNNRSIINSSIINSRTCAFVNVGIGYHSDINRAMEIIREEALKHPLLIDNRTKKETDSGVPQVIIRVVEWGTSSINLRAWVWAANSGNAFVLKCDLLQSVKERFDAESIEIPYPYTNVIVKKE